jgi:hypothetical protein
MNSLEIINKLQSLEDEEIKWMTSEPLLKFEPEIGNLLEALKRVLEI